MPRKAKPTTGTQSATGGRPTQAAVAPTGLAYGENQALMEGMAAAPLAGPAGVPTPPPPAGPAPAAAPGALMAQVMQQAQQLSPGQGDVWGPSQHPNEPITTGAPFGAGPGPARRGRSVSDTLAE